jgi:hypothetical protein
VRDERYTGGIDCIPLLCSEWDGMGCMGNGKEIPFLDSNMRI